ncbi:MAG: hypothetical protein LT070_04465, partial [Solirubrobacteraceae bacterium]|nr:hypothetical protein [Solirubrobacteraceae bacterium]
MSSEAADHPTDDAGEPAIGVVAMHDGADPSAAPVDDAGPVQAADVPFPQAEATPPADASHAQAEPTPLADAPPPQAEATPPADASHAQA